MAIDLAFMVNHLPPQAYSKETLIQAYNWLRHQPPQVQELAKTPDVLVSLFNKAQMHGDSYLNRSHMQNFKTELKSLANMMGDFDPSLEEEGQIGDIEAAKIAVQRKIAQNQTQNISADLGSVKDQNQVQQSANLLRSQEQQEQEIQQLAQQQLQQRQQFEAQQVIATQQQRQQHEAQLQLQQQQQYLGAQLQMSPAVISQHQVAVQQNQNLPSQPTLDMRSIAMIQEVKNQFNLSSESEAIRLLISIGYQKIRTDL